MTSYWLIERADSPACAPLYSYYSNSVQNYYWTTCPYDATWYNSKEAAEADAERFKTPARICEHGFGE